jgi:hypothetical protein
MVFTGQVTSDYLKLVNIPDGKKADFIDFAATDFLTFRNRLIEYIKAVYPLEYQNFVESDLGMMLVEVVAYCAAVNSLKADMLAQEAFLKTAKNRNNVRKLLQLIGVNMKGPIGSSANAKLTLNTPATVATITVPASQRTVTIASPEDGGPLNFTLYKVVNGQIADLNSNASLSLGVSESDSSTSSVWTNLAYLEGSLIVESGSFTDSQTIKRIQLSQTPVIQNSVQVYVTDGVSVSGAWRFVDSLLFASGAGDQIFEVVYNDDLTATVNFGDGVLGSSPGINTGYVVTYRVGGGSRGNLQSEAINTSVNITEGYTAVVENISIATGGQDAETVEHAKKYAPYTFKQQDRLVTLEDFTSFANTYVTSTGATGKARAVTRTAHGSANIVDIYLLQKASNTQLQQATTAFKLNLLQAIEPKRLMNTKVVIVDGLIRTLDLIMTVRIDKELKPKEEVIKGKIQQELFKFFNVDNFDFGKTLVISELNRAIFKLDEVRYATVDNLDSDVVVEMNEIIQLNNFTINMLFV